MEHGDVPLVIKILKSLTDAAEKDHNSASRARHTTESSTATTDGS